MPLPLISARAAGRKAAKAFLTGMYSATVRRTVACDFYHHYEEDIRMLAEGGQNAYRFSIAWTRILPDGTGRKSQGGIDFYHRVIDTCRKYHVEPLVTLYHYDLPESIYEAGGWETAIS